MSRVASILALSLRFREYGNVQESIAWAFLRHSGAVARQVPRLCDGLDC